MTDRKKSKEELFLAKLYELASASGDPAEEVDRYAVGKALGWHTKSIDHIVQILTKTNFVKKGEDKLIYLTSSGIALGEEIQSE